MQFCSGVKCYGIQNLIPNGFRCRQFGYVIIIEMPLTRTFTKARAITAIRGSGNVLIHVSSVCKGQGCMCFKHMHTAKGQCGRK